MSLTLGIAIYFICWWIIIFTILPIGVRTQEEEGEVVPGTAQSAPAAPNLLWKMALTTVVSGVVSAIIYVVLIYKLISLDAIPIY